MKTLLKTICLLFCLGFVTESNAQTKEETITWIKEKIEKYPFLQGTKVIEVNECEIILRTYYRSNPNKIFEEITLPTNPESFDDTNSLNYKNKSIKIVTSKGAEYENVIAIINYSREEDLGKRFVTALKHLNTFCEKKKETF